MMSTACDCNDEKIRAVHAYLVAHSPALGLDDFHEQTRLMRGTVVAGSANHHVVRGVDAQGRRYHVILLSEFLERPVDEIGACLRQWNLAGTLQAHFITVVAEGGLFPL